MKKENGMEYRKILATIFLIPALPFIYLGKFLVGNEMLVKEGYFWKAPRSEKNFFVKLKENIGLITFIPAFPFVAITLLLFERHPYFEIKNL